MKKNHKIPDFLTHGYAVVFAGGGAKGAWQIGAWKAFEEYGIPRAELVSGTSVGALNAALYSQGDLESAEKIWNSLTTEKVLYDFQESEMAKLAPVFRLAKKSFTYTKDGIAGLCALLQQIIPMTLYPLPPKRFWVDYLDFLNKNVGIFCQDGLKNLMQDGLSRNTGDYRIPAIVCAHNKHKGEVEYFDIQKESFDGKVRKLLASTAIPFIFPNVEIRKKLKGVMLEQENLYCDGGFGVEKPLYFSRKHNAVLDNFPIRPLARERFNRKGLKTVIAFALNPAESFRFEDPELTELQVFPVVPSEDLGNPLDFSPEKIKERMDLGYRDAREWLTKACEDFSLVRQMEFLDARFADRKKQIDEISAMREKLRDQYAKVLSREHEALDFLLQNPHPAEVEYYRENHQTIKNYPRCPFSRHGEDTPDYDEQSCAFCEDMNEFSRERAQLEIYDSIRSRFSGFSLLHPFASKKQMDEAREVRRKNVESLGKLGTLLLKAVNLCSMKLDQTQLQILNGVLDGCNQDFSDAINHINILREIGKRDCARYNEIHNRSVPAGNSFTNVSRLSPSSFVDREKDLKEIQQIFDSAPDRIPLIWGDPGIGKQTLIRKFMEENQEKFPGGRIRIPAGKGKSIPEIINELFHEPEILTCLNINIGEAEKKLGAREKFELIKKHLLERNPPVLLFLDDVTDPKILRQEEIDQYFTQNEIERIRIIASSQGKAGGGRDRLMPYHLQGMTERESFRMLGVENPDKLAEAERISAKEVIKMLQGNAQALKYAYDILADMERITGRFSALYEKLRSFKPSETDILNMKAMVEPSLQKLSPKALLFVEYASLFSADSIPLQWLKKAAGCQDEDEFERILFELRSFLDFDGELRYGTMHRIMQAGIRFVRPQELQKIAPGFCEFLAGEIQNGSLSVKDTAVFSQMLLQWCQSEWKRHLLPVLFSLNEHHDLIYFVCLNGLAEEALRLQKEIKELLEAVEDPVLKKKYQASYLIFCGFIARIKGLFDEAVDCFENAIRLREEVFPETSIFKALPMVYLATVYSQMPGRQEDAEKYFQLAFPFYRDFESSNHEKSGKDRKAGWDVLSAFYLQYANFLYKKNALPDEVKAALRKAAAFGQKSMEEPNIQTGIIFRHLGVFYQKRGDFPNAQKYLEWSNRIFSHFSLPDYPHPGVGVNNGIIREINAARSGGNAPE